MRGKRGEVIGVVIHIVSVAGLGGTAMSAPVVSYDAIAVIQEEHHLGVPVVGRQRPAVRENDGLTFAPVLVINLSAVFRRDRCHWMTSLTCWNCENRIV